MCGCVRVQARAPFAVHVKMFNSRTTRKRTAGSGVGDGSGSGGDGGDGTEWTG